MPWKPVNRKYQNQYRQMHVKLYIPDWNSKRKAQFKLNIVISAMLAILEHCNIYFETKSIIKMISIEPKEKTLNRVHFQNCLYFTSFVGPFLQQFSKVVQQTFANCVVFLFFVALQVHQQSQRSQGYLSQVPKLTCIQKQTCSRYMHSFK